MGFGLTNNIYQNYLSGFLRPLGFLTKPKTGSDPWYHVFTEDRAYIENDVPLKELEANKKPGERVVNSESMAYGVLRAVKDNDQVKFNQLMNTVYHLSKQNYSETRTIKLLPWAVYVKDRFRIPSLKKNQNYGNASAADADIDLLTGMIMAAQKDWGGRELKSFIYLYAQDFIDQVVKVRSTEKGSFMIIAKGGLIPGEKKDDGNVYHEFYPSYPNYNYMEYIADYFANDSISNTQGSVYLHKHFTQLLKDTKELMGELKGMSRKYPVGSFPESVDVAVEFSGNIIIKDKQGHKDSDSVRLYWRTQDEYFKTWGDKLNAKIDYREKLLDRSKNKISTLTNNYNYYYYYLKEVSSLIAPEKIAPLRSDNRFKLDDILLNENCFTHVGNAFSKHWGGFLPSGFGDQRFRIENDVVIKDFSLKAQEVIKNYKGITYDADRNKLKVTVELSHESLDVLLEEKEIKPYRSIIKYMQHYALVQDAEEKQRDRTPYSAGMMERAYRTKATDKFSLEVKIEFAAKLCDSKDYLDKGLRAYEDTMVQLLQKGSLKETRLTKSIANLFRPKDRDFNKEYVSGYVNALRVMKGFSDNNIKERLDRLIATAPDKYNTENALLKGLYLEKLLLWHALDKDEKKEMKVLAEKFGLKDLYDYQEYFDEHRGEDALHTRNFSVNIEGVDIDTKNEKLTLGKIKKYGLSENLEEKITKEIIKRDIVGLNKSEAAFEKIRGYVKKLKGRDRQYALSLVVYSKKLSLHNRKQLIEFGLESLTDKKNKDYTQDYLTLWKAYQLCLNEEHNKLKDRYNAHIEAGGRSIDAGEFNYWLHILNRERDITKILFGEVVNGGVAMPDYKPKATKTESSNELMLKITNTNYSASLDNGIVGLLEGRFDPILFNKYKNIKSYDYGDLVAETITMNYWMGHGTSGIFNRKDSDKKISRIKGNGLIDSSYKQGFKSYMYNAKNILENYKAVYNKSEDNDYWEKQHSIVAIKYTIDIIEMKTIGDVMRVDVDEIISKETEAKEYKHYQSYATLMLAEWTFYKRAKRLNPEMHKKVFLDDKIVKLYPYIIRWIEGYKDYEN